MRPVQASAAMGGWKWKSPREISRWRLRNGVFSSTQLRCGCIGFTTPQPMQGAPASTHHETERFQRVTGHVVNVWGPRQPSGYRQ